MSDFMLINLKIHNKHEFLERYKLILTRIYSNKMNLKGKS